jgi:hypothetical protein
MWYLGSDRINRITESSGRALVMIPCVTFRSRVIFIVAPLKTSKVHTKTIQCRIWGFHGGDYEEFRLLGCGAMWVYYKPTFRRMSTPFSGEKKYRSEETCNAVPKKVEATRSSETSVYNKSTRHHIPEDFILKLQFSLYNRYWCFPWKFQRT